MGHKIDFGSKRRTKTIPAEDLPELGESITLKGISKGQLDALEQGDASNTTKLLALSIIDPESGELLYTTEEDYQNLAQMSVSVYRTLINAVNDLNGISKKAVDDTEKKSEASLSTASGSA